MTIERIIKNQKRILTATAATFIVISALSCSFATNRLLTIQKNKSLVAITALSKFMTDNIDGLSGNYARTQQLSQQIIGEYGVVSIRKNHFSKAPTNSTTYHNIYSSEHLEIQWKNWWQIPSLLFIFKIIFLVTIALTCFAYFTLCYLIKNQTAKMAKSLKSLQKQAQLAQSTKKIAHDLRRPFYLSKEIIQKSMNPGMKPEFLKEANSELTRISQEVENLLDDILYTHNPLDSFRSF
jgi:hypothetical protein